MIPRNELRKIAHAKLKDAEVLYFFLLFLLIKLFFLKEKFGYKNRRYDSAVYLCGYAVEVALKVRICKTLRWAGYPSTRSEFQPYQSFKTHDLNVLLSLSGVESKIKIQYFTEWSNIATWDAEVRYKSIGTANRNDAFNMIESAKTLLKVI
jgi:HEPN domain-containing protein